MKVFNERVVCLLSLFTFAIASTTKDVHSECLPSTDELNSFQCISSRGKPSGIPCIDVEETQCPNWAKKGECSKNPQYMLINCRKSCDSCIGLHSGVMQIAPEDKTRDKVLKALRRTQEYMHKQAEKSVSALTQCENKHELCTHWSVLGECRTNSGFMTTECAPACRSCHMVT